MAVKSGLWPMWLMRSIKLPTSTWSSLSEPVARRCYKGAQSRKPKNESGTIMVYASSGTWERRPFDEIFTFLPGLSLFHAIGGSRRKSYSRPAGYTGSGNWSIGGAQGATRNRIERRFCTSGKLNESGIRFLPSLEQEGAI